MAAQQIPSWHASCPENFEFCRQVKGIGARSPPHAPDSGWALPHRNPLASRFTAASAGGADFAMLLVLLVLLRCLPTPVTPDTPARPLSPARSYDMVASFMQSQRHKRGIHVVWPWYGWCQSHWRASRAPRCLCALWCASRLPPVRPRRPPPTRPAAGGSAGCWVRIDRNTRKGPRR